ncbi:MAG: hypothetical protein EOM22_08435 [Gammaproteobacteria bacterium]|nr:hypothetical protein [Gammaproteobacteria bacterium]
MDGITLDAITWPFPTRIETGLSLRYDCPEDIDAVTDNLLEAQDRAEGMVGDAIHVAIREAAGVLVGVQYVDEVVGGGTFDF